MNKIKKDRVEKKAKNPGWTDKRTKWVIEQVFSGHNKVMKIKILYKVREIFTLNFRYLSSLEVEKISTPNVCTDRQTFRVSSLLKRGKGSFI